MNTNYGFTQTERNAFKRKAKDSVREEMLIQFLLTLALLFVIAYALDNVFHLTDIAHAQTPVQAYTTADYCNLIARTGEPVANATHEQLLAVCPNLK